MKIKLYITAFISLIILSSCGAPTGSKDDSVVSNLKSETKWYCNPSTKEILYKVSYKEYSIQGKITKNVQYNLNGLPYSQSDYSYKDNISIETVNFFDTAGKVDSTLTSTSKFDNYGRTISLVESNSKGDTVLFHTFKYDDKGNLVLKVEKLQNSSKFSEINFTNVYNESGQIIERIESFNNTGNFSSKDSIIYNTKDNQIQKVTSNFDGSVISIKTYTYDNTGKIVIESTSDKTGKIVNYYRFEYKFY